MTDQAKYFQKQMAGYRQQIEVACQEFVTEWQQEIERGYGQYSQQSFEALAAIMLRGGKRIRGALVMESYRMFGGQQSEVALRAAVVMEVIQTYLLMADDVADQSQRRRGGPAAHVLLTELHQDNQWSGQSQHFGQSMAMTVALLGAHKAMEMLAELPVSPEIRLAALANVNRCLSVTIQGQINDIVGQAASTESRRLVDSILAWKTAYYTFVNPLQLGAILAGAAEWQVQKLLPFSVAAGKLFQLGDDLIGLFAADEQSGKSVLDDVKEGKRTMLMMVALEQAQAADATFLRAMLGNQQLTLAELERCQEIVRQSGAVEQVRQQMAEELQTAELELRGMSEFVDRQGRDFLQGMVEYLLERKS